MIINATRHTAYSDRGDLGTSIKPIDGIGSESHSYSRSNMPIEMSLHYESGPQIMTVISTACYSKASRCWTIASEVTTTVTIWSAIRSSPSILLLP